ncbi:unnamed protein product [Musa acuminata subsp. malaccensis]|uniref:(wild Malaysian banana) hypothetical protein n=1 Tax=Musa acuminata subsp. malaccensis TaxID=214687 RepID=A0A8D7EY00_MUSAM|nr:unnamed protein product [Musa acuminata subsp. malaccensis]
MKIVPTKIRKLWSADEIRILVLLSLGFQIVLIVVSLFRKRCQNRLLSFILWTSYLGADYVAALALGNLLNDETEASEQNINGDLTAFWAPFLLLHLGGPDTITSYSLEDNELWLRHFLGLVLEVSVAILVFLESLPSPHLWKVAIVVFIAGILKYAERTLALWSASMDQLRESMISDPDPGPNYVKFMQEYHSRVTAGLNADIKTEKEPRPPLPKDTTEKRTDKEIIFGAYRFFPTIKRLTVDLMLSFQDRIESQTFFLTLEATRAFFMVDVELSLLHDILHTKAVHVHTLGGRLVRALSLSLVVLAFVLFHRSGRHNFSEADIIITYILLLAAVGLEAIAAVLLVFSDWTIVALQDSGKLERPFIARLKKIIRFLKLDLAIVKFRGGTRWSNSMRQCNLLCICLRDYEQTVFTRILHFLGLKELWDSYWHVEDTIVGDQQKTLIFEELKKKTYGAEGESTEYKRLRACKGEWVLREKGYTDFDWSMNKEFDESGGGVLTSQPMAMEFISRKIRKLWIAEQIRILVLLSLALQIILIFFSLFRKRSSKTLLRIILCKQIEASDQHVNCGPIALWETFLLLHLGGPDTATSYSLEDNELWLRHLIGLLYEVTMAIVLFLESLPSPHLWKIAIVVFTAGILKYAERTLALWSARMDRLKQSMITEQDPGPDYYKFMKAYRSSVTAGLKASFEMAISVAYRFFESFKSLTVNLMLSLQDQIESQTFLRGKWNQAFQVVDFELSFLHDILHTKAAHVHTLLEKHDFNEADVTITNVLLLAALGLETIAVVVTEGQEAHRLYGVENTDVDDDLKTLIFKELKGKAHSAVAEAIASPLRGMGASENGLHEPPLELRRENPVVAHRHVYLLPDGGDQCGRREGSH